MKLKNPLKRLYTEHQNYLIAIENQCLLSRDMKPFQRNINNLISLIVQFSHLYQKIRNNNEDSEGMVIYKQKLTIIFHDNKK